MVGGNVVARHTERGISVSTPKGPWTAERLEEFTELWR